jgi:hypothetical protein
MSQLNGDRARFHKNRKRRLALRQRIRALAVPAPNGLGASAARKTSGTRAPTDAQASMDMHDEGGPMRAGD